MWLLLLRGRSSVHVPSPPLHFWLLPFAPAGRLQSQRLQQLQREAEQKARLQQAGHGGLTDVPEQRLLHEAESSPVPLVCHLAFEGSHLDDELDEHLARLAHEHLGTRFVRTLINLRSMLHLRLRSPPGPGKLLPCCHLSVDLPVFFPQHD